jgi:hypothetical protein
LLFSSFHITLVTFSYYLKLFVLFFLTFITFYYLLFFSYLFLTLSYSSLHFVSFSYFSIQFVSVVPCSSVFFFFFKLSFFLKEKKSILMGASTWTRPSPHGRMAASARTHFHPLMWHEGVTSRHGAGITSRGQNPSFPPPLQIARYGPTFPTLACLAFGWWWWVPLISLPPYYRLVRKWESHLCYRGISSTPKQLSSFCR